MSLKPPKKGDLDKSWMRKRQDRAIKMQPEYHLIVTEGTKTEPQYFQAIKDVINAKYRGKIQLDIYGEGDNTISLFEKARNRATSSVVYKHVWVVFDIDDFPAERINRTAELCNEASNGETTYHAAWSNQCIELWYLLHFVLPSSTDSDLCSSMRRHRDHSWYNSSPRISSPDLS